MAAPVEAGLDLVLLHMVVLEECWVPEQVFVYVEDGDVNILTCIMILYQLDSCE